jgi:hypothetical protein
MGHNYRSSPGEMAELLKAAVLKITEAVPTGTASFD